MIIVTANILFIQLNLPIYSNDKPRLLNKIIQVHEISSSSSSSGVFFCLNGQIKCTGSSLTAICSDSSYNPKCLSGGASIECCKENDAFLDCRQDLSISCTNIVLPGSSSSSSGNVSPLALCFNGSVTCLGGLTPICSDPIYSPKCLSGGAFIECCRTTQTSLDCKSNLAILCTTQTSSSSSGTSSNSTPYCSLGMIFCTSGTNAACSNPSYLPRCLPGDFPDCCKQADGSLDCKADLLLCTPTVSTNRFQTVNLDIVSNPQFPEVIDLPFVLDTLVGKVGFAYRGSNPSYEIKLPISNPELVIESVDLKDSKDFIFNNTPFIATEIAGSPEKLILNLEIPESISTGEARFAINLSDKSSYTGIIQIISPFDIKVFKKNGIDTKAISKPDISNIIVRREKNQISLSVTGRNFLSKKYLLERNGVTEVIQNKDAKPNTFITIFPSNIKPEIAKNVVSNNRKLIKIKFKTNESIEEKTKAVLVLSTPRGIISKQFTINPKSKDKRTGITVNFEKLICFMGKPTCEDGKKAFCSNSSFTPKCLPAGTFALPDCCKGKIKTDFKDDDDSLFNCNPSLLRCR